MVFGAGDLRRSIRGGSAGRLVLTRNDRTRANAWMRAARRLPEATQAQAAGKYHGGQEGISCQVRRAPAARSDIGRQHLSASYGLGFKPTHEDSVLQGGKDQSLCICHGIFASGSIRTHQDSEGQRGKRRASASTPNRRAHFWALLFGKNVARGQIVVNRTKSNVIRRSAATSRIGVA